jgi:hypothetical protein
MENTRDSHLFTLRKVVSKYAKNIFLRIMEENVHREYAKSILLYSPYTPMDINLSLQYISATIKIRKDFDPRSSSYKGWVGRKNHLTLLSLLS